MSVSEKVKAEILRGEELLWLCQDLQSAKDGIDRPSKDCWDKSKTLDDFAMDINRSATYMVSLLKLLPMNDKLTELGKKLEADGKIEPLFIGNSYSDAALNYLLKEHFGAITL